MECDHRPERRPKRCRQAEDPLGLRESICITLAACVCGGGLVFQLMGAQESHSTAVGFEAAHMSIHLVSLIIALLVHVGTSDRRNRCFDCCERLENFERFTSLIVIVISSLWPCVEAVRDLCADIHKPKGEEMMEHVGVHMILNSAMAVLLLFGSFDFHHHIRFRRPTWHLLQRDEVPEVAVEDGPLEGMKEERPPADDRKWCIRWNPSLTHVFVDLARNVVELFCAAFIWHSDKFDFLDPIVTIVSSLSIIAAAVFMFFRE